MIFDHNIIVPIQLIQIVTTACKANIAIAKDPTQVYVKYFNQEGELSFKNGNSYKGQFYNGMLHGFGKFTWLNGNIYQGQFIYNSITGYGTFYFFNGSIYKGNLLEGQFYGQGTLKTQQYEYQGSYFKGLKHGYGKLTFKDNQSYAGEFKYGLKQGKGTLIYKSGNKYVGQWKNDQKNGYGQMDWINISQRYKGQWSNNKQHGWGNYIYMQGRGFNKLMRNRYQGQWYQGKRDRVGTMFYADGCLYIGQWKDNNKDGKGLFLDQMGILHLVENSKGVQIVRQQVQQQTSRCYLKKKINSGQNPYTSMIKYSHYRSCCNIQRVRNIFLRFNSQLRQLYRFISQRQQYSQYYFGINLQCIWNLLSQYKILGGYLSLANLNRSISVSTKNLFRLNSNSKYIQKALKYSQLTSYKLKWLQIAQRIIQDKKIYVSLIQPQQVHSKTKPIPFYLFIQSLFKAALIKYPNKTADDSIKQFLLILISNTQNHLKQQSKSSQQKSSCLIKKKQVPSYAKAANQKLFKKICSKKRLLSFNDCSIKIGKLIDILCRNQLLENQFDINQYIKFLFKNIQSDKIYTQKNLKRKDKISTNQKRILLNKQIIFEQFSQLIYPVISRKVNNQADSLTFQNKSKNYNCVIDQIFQTKPIPAFIYPVASQTKKDKLIKQYQIKRQKQLQQLQKHIKLQQQLEQQRQERNQMKLQDYDVQNLSQSQYLENQFG